MEKTILFVDDEEAVLRAFKRCFLFSDYPVYLASSGEEALKILSSAPISIIISDIRMPQMDGYSLLKIVREKYPDVIRIILSGYADEEILVKAFQKNLAKMYLLKPWDNEELLQMLEIFFSLEERLQGKNLPFHLNHLEDLPPLGFTYYKIQDLIEKDRSMDEIAKAIGEDPAIAARLLRVVNSAFYRVNTASIKDALLYLGLVNTKNIILTSSVLDWLEKDRVGNLYQETLWRHSSLCNKISNVLFRYLLDKEVPKTHTTAGLFHDLGRVFLVKYFGGNYPHKRPKENQTISAQEKESLGIDHSEMGAFLLNCWELSLPIIEAAMYHHHPLDENIIHKELVAIVHLADYFAHKIIRARYQSHIYPQIFDFFGVSEQEIAKILSTKKGLK